METSQTQPDEEISVEFPRMKERRGYRDEDRVLSLLRSEEVSHEELLRRYRFLGVIRIGLGALPNSCKYSMIHEPVFFTENILAPSLLNLPKSLFGASLSLQYSGLCMYASARALSCAYCSLHSCGIVLRNHGTERAIKGQRLTCKERICVDLGTQLASIPTRIDPSLHDLLSREFNPQQVEWLLLGGALMGWLSTTMQTLGMDIEGNLVAEAHDILAQTGWKPGRMKVSSQSNFAEAWFIPLKVGKSMLYKMRAVKYAKAAIEFENSVLRNIPKTKPAIQNYLQDVVGFNWPSLTMIQDKRACRSLASTICNNFSPQTTAVPLFVKYLIGLGFASAAENAAVEVTMGKLVNGRDVVKQEVKHLAAELLKRMTATKEPDESSFDGLEFEATITTLMDYDGMGRKDAVAIIYGLIVGLVRATIGGKIVRLIENELSAKEIIDLTSTTSLLVLLNRLDSFFTSKAQATSSQVESTNPVIVDANEKVTKTNGTSISTQSLNRSLPKVTLPLLSLRDQKQLVIAK